MIRTKAGKDKKHEKDKDIKDCRTKRLRTKGIKINRTKSIKIKKDKKLFIRSIPATLMAKKSRNRCESYPCRTLLDLWII